MKPIKTIEDIQEQITLACQVYMIYTPPQPKGFSSSLCCATTANSSKYSFKPTPQEIDDADEVQFEWLPILMPLDRQIVWKRCSNCPWKRIAFEEGISERTARKKYLGSLDKLATHLIKRKR